MKRATVLGTSVAAAMLIALPIPALESGAAQGSTAHLPRASASIAASAPPRLVALERKMRSLRINTARLSLREISRGPVKKEKELFEVGGPSSRGRSHEGTGTKSKSRRPRGGSRTRIKTQTLLSGRIEISRSPSLELLHERLFGAVRVRGRRIGEEVYIHEPLIAKTDGGRPWVSRKRSKKEAEDSLGDGHDGPFGQIAHELAGARSVAEVGPRTIGGHQTLEFYATLDPRRVYSSLFHERSHGDAKLLRKLRNAIERAEVTLRVWFERDGLPVKIVEVTANGKSELRSTARILATEIPVSVESPPATETISEQELKKLEKRRLEAPEALEGSGAEVRLGEPAAIG